nr:hypothetical protein BgiMline_003350 [Biomphalaria glabrata]
MYLQATSTRAECWMYLQATSTRAECWMYLQATSTRAECWMYLQATSTRAECANPKGFTEYFQAKKKLPDIVNNRSVARSGV